VGLEKFQNNMLPHNLFSSSRGVNSCSMHWQTLDPNHMVMALGAGYWYSLPNVVSFDFWQYYVELEIEVAY